MAEPTYAPVFAASQDSTPIEQTTTGEVPVLPPEAGPVPLIRGDFRDMVMTTGKGKVTGIIDGVTLELDNEKKVRLTGVWVPWETGNDPGENVQKAVVLLKKIAYGRFVRLYQGVKQDVGRTNRMGDILAQAERDDGMWLQGALIYAGLGFVMTSESNPELAERMYKVEEDARKRKAGLWADPRWGILTPEQVPAFVNEFRIVEGTVFSTAMRNNVFYINFGRDWKTDFTVSVPSNRRVAFARAGMDMQKLNGKHIRVRGWVRHYNGPMIEVTHPQQIEVLD
jgi:endonuclease YncB( thermonuclease family)